MNLKLIFELKILSEYHIASGVVGDINIDSTLIRDKKGSPIIRGSTIAGLFRYAAQQLIRNGSKDLQDCFQEIFGTEKNAGSWLFGTATTNASVRLNDLDQKSFARTKQGVRIDPITRRAQETKLFTKELGNDGLTFEFMVEHLGTKERDKDAASILVAAARLIRGIGSGVNRGAGQCLISLKSIEGISDNINQREMLKHFGMLYLQKDRDKSFSRIPKVMQEIEVSHDKYLVLAQGIQPIIISDNGFSGNEYSTIDYIPGGVLLGAFARKYINSNSIEGEENYNRFIEIFRRGNVRFGNLYPSLMHNNGRKVIPSIPVMQDMLTCKHSPFTKPGSHESYPDKGYATAAIPDRCPICTKEVPMVSIKGYMPIYRHILYKSSDKVVQVHKNFEPHVAIRENERRADEGKLFFYETLSENQFFVGEMTCGNKELMTELLDLCTKNEIGYELELFIGKGTKRGYGKTRITLIPSTESWINPNDIRKRINEDGVVTLSFLSDTIIHDPWGRTMSTFTPESLSSLLDVEVAEVLNSFVSTKEVIGFSGISGLPRFNDLAIRAGSAIGFVLKQPFDLEKVCQTLEKIENEGLGFRRSEGFGSVAFNHIIYNAKDLEDRYIFIPLQWRADKDEKEIWARIQSSLFHTGVSIPIGKKVASRIREFGHWLSMNSHLQLEDLKKELESYGELPILAEFDIGVRQEKENMFSEFSKHLSEHLDTMSGIMERRINFDVGKDDSLKEYYSNILWPKCVQWLANRLIEYAEEGNYE